MTRHLDLFSGTGGFSLAAQWTGKVEAAGFCEIDPTCRRVLAKHWPGVKQYDDIRTLTGDALASFGTVDLITGGYPCQPFSLAGQRRGTADDRHLWPEMRRVINECRPRYVLAENVVGHVSMGLDTVLAELESDGYACGAIVIPACAVNALHRRDRIWIMAYSDAHTNINSKPDGTINGEQGQGELGEPITSISDAIDLGRIRANDEIRTGRNAVDAGSTPIMGDADSQGLEGRQLSRERTGEWTSGKAGSESFGSAGDETSRTLDAGTYGIPAGLDGRLASRSAWRDGSWEVSLPRVVTEELNRKAKLMAAGNAIVPQVAYEILSVMLEGEPNGVTRT